MKKGILSLCVAFLAMFTSGFASAAYVYGDPVLGTYYGSGNPSGEWTLSTVGGLELGLRAKNRQTGGLLGNGADGIYNVSPGTCTGGLCGTSTNKANWNYEFSIDPGGDPFLLSGLTYRLGVDHDASAGVNFSYVNPTTYWTDNSHRNAASQNSQNVKFGTTPGGAFDVNQQGLYDFVLQAFMGEKLYNSVSMQVQVGENIPGGTVPEPESLALVMSGLSILTLTRRQKKSASKLANK